MRTSFAIALGSNMRHPLHGAPAGVLKAAMQLLDAAPLRLLAVSPIIQSAPIGPSQRIYANAAALIETELGPEDLLAHLKKMERDFGRRSGGQRWRARPLDLDIVLWSAGPFAGPALIIPHIHLADRSFVLGPLSHIAGEWRHCLTGLSVRHMKARLDRKAPRE